MHEALDDAFASRAGATINATKGMHAQCTSSVYTIGITSVCAGSRRWPNASEEGCPIALVSSMLHLPPYSLIPAAPCRLPCQTEKQQPAAKLLWQVPGNSLTKHKPVLSTWHTVQFLHLARTRFWRFWWRTVRSYSASKPVWFTSLDLSQQNGATTPPLNHWFTPNARDSIPLQMTRLCYATTLLH